jgi:hypothetical protein
MLRSARAAASLPVRHARGRWPLAPSSAGFPAIGDCDAALHGGMAAGRISARHRTTAVIVAAPGRDVARLVRSAADASPDSRRVGLTQCDDAGRPLAAASFDPMEGAH